VEIRKVDFPDDVREVVVAYDFGLASAVETKAAVVRAVVALDGDEGVCRLGKLHKEEEGGRGRGLGLG
jgi:hypothetical protein